MNKTSYLNLVTYRNSLKAKYMAFVDLILDQPLGAAAVTDSILFAFNLDNASGVNLDTIGKLVGVSRLLPFVPTVGTREMNDSEYRMLIRLKIARNVWDGRNEYITSIYNAIFPDLNIQYKDNQDMTVTITATGTFPSRTAEILSASGYVLVPAGVGYNVVTYGGGTEFALYVAVAQHGEVILDKVVTNFRTWNKILSEGMTWGEVKDITWSELLQSSDISSTTVTWQAMKETRMLWGTVSGHSWGYYDNE